MKEAIVKYAQYRDKNCSVVVPLDHDQMVIAGIIALLKSTSTDKNFILGAVADVLHLKSNACKDLHTHAPSGTSTVSESPVQTHSQGSRNYER